ncbi:hypothetical protein HDU76_012148, partial [Blyttiomyces sp. JEL0837]
TVPVPVFSSAPKLPVPPVSFNQQYGTGGVEKEQVIEHDKEDTNTDKQSRHTRRVTFHGIPTLYNPSEGQNETWSDDDEETSVPQVQQPSPAITSNHNSHLRRWSVTTTPTATTATPKWSQYTIPPPAETYFGNNENEQYNNKRHYCRGQSQPVVNIPPGPISMNGVGRLKGAGRRNGMPVSKSCGGKEVDCEQGHEQKKSFTSRLGTSLLSGIDFLGSKLANVLGITTPRYDMYMEDMEEYIQDCNKDVEFGNLDRGAVELVEGLRERGGHLRGGGGGGLGEHQWRLGVDAASR